MPTRLKRQLRTSVDDGVLVAHVEGADPAFIWQFKEPITVRGLTIEAEASRAGYFQAFWTTDSCRTFNEACSVLQSFTKDQRVVDIVFPIDERVRELRLDLSSEPETQVAFSAIGILDEPVGSTGWTANPPTTASSSPDGLTVTATQADPWLVSPSMPFSAAMADTIEIRVSAPAGSRPQVFWTTTGCPHFTEECSATFADGDGGTSAQSLALGGHSRWAGTIQQLRFDPGDQAGDYRIERIALTRSR